MSDLATTFESADCHSVRTYIQSGNVVFSSSSRSKRDLNKKLSNAIEGKFGFRPHVFLLTAADFRDAVAKNPFAESVAEPKSLHFFFLDAIPESPNPTDIVELAAPTERFQLIGNVFYLHAPDGIGRSKLAAGVERRLGVPTTARNFTTIQNLVSLLAVD